MPETSALLAPLVLAVVEAMAVHLVLEAAAQAYFAQAYFVAQAWGQRLQEPIGVAAQSLSRRQFRPFAEQLHYEPRAPQLATALPEPSAVPVAVEALTAEVRRHSVALGRPCALCLKLPVELLSAFLLLAVALSADPVIVWPAVAMLQPFPVVPRL